MFHNQDVANNGVRGGGAGNPIGTSMDPTQQQQQPQQNIIYNGMPQQQQQQQSQTSKNVRKKPYVKITEQPAGKALRFRYECEGRSAGSIPGANSTAENKTYPSIEICGIKGRAVVVVSCVTKDTPYRPHPHNLVGKEGCKKGVCTLEINSETMKAVFSNLGIQCVKKKDIEAALKAREEIRVDPFKTGFAHKLQPSSIDLNAVRLCFQVFIESDQKGRFTDPLRPVVSEPIFDKKAMSDLVICRLCSCSATVLGNTQIILLCEKVAKEDIAVRFFEENNGLVIWEAFGEFQHTDVHKQTAITFKTPRYRTLDITEPAKVFIQLRRPSDGVTSEALPFEYVPLDSGRHTFWNLRRNLKRKPDLDIFQEILTVDGGGSNGELSTLSTKPIEVIDLNTPTKEQQDIQVFVTQPSTDELEEAAIRSSMHEIDTIIDEKVRELEQQREQEQLQHQSTIESMDQDGDIQVTEEPRQLSANDKCNEWMKSNEFVNMPSTETNSSSTPQTTIDNYDKLTPQSTFDEEKTLRELLGQVAELDEIYTDHVMRRDIYNNSILHELNGIDACLPDGDHTAMEIDENFDDAATYTSLQIAFKNPISLPIEDIMPPTPPASHMAPEDAQHYDHVEVMAHSVVLNSPRTETSTVTAGPQSPPRPPAPKSYAAQPHMHITAAVEEKQPPLPPKRQRKVEQDCNAENRSIGANSSDNLDRKSLRQSGTIIIMKTPDQSPPTKRLPAKPDSKFNTLPKQKKRQDEKKPGFFAKLFSRRKSKSDQSEASGSIEPNSLVGSKATSPYVSREPSIKQFPLIDPKRASSIRSVKSLQQTTTSLPSSPAKVSSAVKTKTSKPVGRSVSSVSGKRPGQLNADVIHIPLKGGDSYNSLPQQTNARAEAYSNASTITLGNTLDRRTVSALHLAEIPLCDGNMELVAIADRQSLRNLCEGEFNVQLDPNVDLTEAEHFALYTSIPPVATASEFDEMSAYYASVDAGEILTPDEIAKRLAAANRNH